jgi:hypothetical protein
MTVRVSALASCLYIDVYCHCGDSVRSQFWACAAESFEDNVSSTLATSKSAIIRATQNRSPKPSERVGINQHRPQLADRREERTNYITPLCILRVCVE